MIYKIDEEFYIEDGAEVWAGKSVTYCLKNIVDGTKKELTFKSSDHINKYRVNAADALERFYEAQWIGIKNLEKLTIAMMQEVSEAFNELDWKPWKEKPVNIKAYREELADVGIFLLLCAKTADMTLDDLLSEMIKKHVYNLTRKDHKSRKGE